MTASKWDLPKHLPSLLCPQRGRLGRTSSSGLSIYSSSEVNRKGVELNKILCWIKPLTESQLKKTERGAGTRTCGQTWDLRLRRPGPKSWGRKSGPNEVSRLQGLRDSNDLLNKGSWVTLPATAHAACVSSTVKWVYEPCFWKWGESWGFILHVFCSVNQICPSLQLCAHSQRGAEQV